MRSTKHSLHSVRIKWDRNNPDVSYFATLLIMQRKIIFENGFDGRKTDTNSVSSARQSTLQLVNVYASPLLLDGVIYLESTGRLYTPLFCGSTMLLASKLKRRRYSWAGTVNGWKLRALIPRGMLLFERICAYNPRPPALSRSNANFG